jgi:hypothetical protein
MFEGAEGILERAEEGPTDLSWNVSLVGEVLKRAFAVTEDSLGARRLCRLLLLLPAVELPMELRFFLIFDCTFWGSLSPLPKLRLLCWPCFFSSPG